MILNNDNVEEIVDKKISEQIASLSKQIGNNTIRKYPKQMEYNSKDSSWTVKIPLIICPDDKYDFVKFLDFDTASKQYQSVILNLTVEVEK